MERVHEYGETFDLYPCEECGYRGTDITSIRKHIADNHERSETSSESLEDLGIVSLPVVTKRRRQNLHDLIIDENGEIEVDDEDDEDFSWRDELLMLEEEDIPSKSLRHRKPVARKRKADEKAQEPKRQRMEKSTNILQCLQCDVSFTRKDNLSRHIRNKH